MWDSKDIFTARGASRALSLIEEHKPPKEKQLEFLDRCKKDSMILESPLSANDVASIFCELVIYPRIGK